MKHRILVNTLRIAALLALLLGWSQRGPAQVAEGSSGGWQSLFNGRDLTGWKAAEQPASFRVVEGAICAQGPRAHLFYIGDHPPSDDKHFEFQVEIKADTGANSGVFFHTAYQERDWPRQGFEVQVYNGRQGSGDYRELKLTGSLCGVRNVYQPLVADGEWFTLRIAVRGPRVQVWVNQMLTVDYLESNPPLRLPGFEDRVLSRGTFALQAHDPESRVWFRHLKVRPLPETLDAEIAPTLTPAAFARELEIRRLLSENFPLVDLHGHLKGGLTLDQLLAWSRRTGINYGIAPNCGLGFAITNDAGIYRYLDEVKGRPVFLGMQAEGREWTRLFSREAIGRFDYVFTDAMTFTDAGGRRMRLWIKEEVDVPDPQAFMEMYVRQIETILSQEPIDIYVNPTFLPECIAAQYDTLWTPERMQRVIDAAAQHRVAIEINARYRLPNAVFIKRAKQAGVKFTLGTNNGDADLGHLDYSLAMVRECGLTWQDMFLPQFNGKTSGR